MSIVRTFPNEIRKQLASVVCTTLMLAKPVINLEATSVGPTFHANNKYANITSEGLDHSRAYRDEKVGNSRRPKPRSLHLSVGRSLRDPHGLDVLGSRPFPSSARRLLGTTTNISKNRENP